MSLTAIRPAAFPWLRTESYTFSLGLRDGDNAWLSGHSASGFDPDAGRVVVKGGMGEQAETAYRKIGVILEAAGLGFGDVTRVTENVTLAGLGTYAEAEQARHAAFGEHGPALVTVAVDRLLRPDALIEVQVDASRGGGRALGGGLREGHDGAVFLPGILPVEGGDVVAPGDLPGQYRFCLERAGELLEAAGLGLDRIVRTVDFSTPATRAAYPGCADPRRELLGPVFPAAAGILMNGLPAPGALVALDVIASRHEPERVNPGWDRYATLTYSPGVRAGSTLYLAGFAALDPATGRPLAAGDVVEQARSAYASLLAVVEAAGGGPEHLIETVEYVCPQGLRGYRGVGDVRRALLREPWPSSTGIVCGALLRPELLFEVVPTAVLSA